MGFFLKTFKRYVWFGRKFFVVIVKGTKADATGLIKELSGNHSYSM